MASLPLRPQLLRSRRISALAAGFLCTSAAAARADLLVGPGDDLVAITNAAADGETLILESNGTFTGTLSWFQKTLTFKAGEGFHPTIRGGENQPAVILSANSNVVTGARFRGLRLLPGLVTSVSPLDVSLLCTGTGSSPQLVDIDLEGCQLPGGLVVGGTGDHQTEIHATDSELGDVSIGGTGDAGGNLIADRCDFNSIQSGSTGSFSSAFTLTGCEILGAVALGPISSASVDFTARRTRFQASFDLNASSTSVAEALLVSCLFDGPGLLSGNTAIHSRAPAVVRGINLTVRAYETAIDTDAPSRFSNLLIFLNGSALGALVAPADLDHSMLGSLPAGFNVAGNFQGAPNWDADFALLPGSPGIDAGDSTIPGLGNLDLDGGLRITDGDGDGNARINVGALEHYGDCPAASAVLLNGSGINPEACQITALPAMGGTFRAVIQPTPNTVASVLAYDQTGLFPLVLTGIEGEVLLALTVNTYIDIQSGSHQASVPNEPLYCGRTLSVQGLRVILNGALLGTQALNGWELTIGY